MYIVFFSMNYKVWFICILVLKENRLHDVDTKMNKYKMKFCRRGQSHAMDRAAIGTKCSLKMCVFYFFFTYFCENLILFTVLIVQ